MIDVSSKNHKSWPWTYNRIYNSNSKYIKHDDNNHLKPSTIKYHQFSHDFKFVG